MKALKHLAAKFPSLANANLDSTNYEVRVRPQARHPIGFILRKLATQLVLMPVYLLFVAPLVALGAFRWFRLTPDARALLRDYCGRFWYYPSLCIHKAVEGRKFRQARIISPSCDIGCEDGIVTALHFPRVVFDVGVEYIPENSPAAGVHREVVIAGLPRLPEAWTARFQSVALVHVIDHVKELEPALTELRRIARPGGTTCLSGFADGYSRNVRRNSLGLLDEQWLEERKGLHHFLTLEEWRWKFESAGFVVRRLEAFLGGWRGRLWAALHALLEINGSNDLYYAANRLGVLPGFVRNGICLPLALALSALFVEDPAMEHPCHFYAELEVPR